MRESETEKMSDIVGGELFPIPRELLYIHPYGVLWYAVNFPVLLGWFLVYQIEILTLLIGTFFGLILRRHYLTAFSTLVIGLLFAQGNVVYGVSSLLWAAWSVESPLCLAASLLDRLPFTPSEVSQAASFGLIWEKTRLFRYSTMVIAWGTSLVFNLRKARWI